MADKEPFLVVRYDSLALTSMTIIYPDDEETKMHREVRFEFGQKDITRYEGVYPETPRDRQGKINTFVYSEGVIDEDGIENKFKSPDNVISIKKVKPEAMAAEIEKIKEVYDDTRASGWQYGHALNSVDLAKLQERYAEPEIKNTTPIPQPETPPISIISGSYQNYADYHEDHHEIYFKKNDGQKLDKHEAAVIKNIIEKKLTELGLKLKNPRIATDNHISPWSVPDPALVTGTFIAIKADATEEMVPVSNYEEQYNVLKETFNNITKSDFTKLVEEEKKKGDTPPPPIKDYYDRYKTLVTHTGNGRGSPAPDPDFSHALRFIDGQAQSHHLKLSKNEKNAMAYGWLAFRDTKDHPQTKAFPNIIYGMGPEKINHLVSNLLEMEDRLSKHAPESNKKHEALHIAGDLLDFFENSVDGSIAVYRKAAQKELRTIIQKERILINNYTKAVGDDPEAMKLLEEFKGVFEGAINTKAVPESPQKPGKPDRGKS